MDAAVSPWINRVGVAIARPDGGSVGADDLCESVCCSQAMTSLSKIKTLAIAEMSFIWGAAGTIKQHVAITRVPMRDQAVGVYNVLELIITALFAVYVFWSISRITMARRRRRGRQVAVRLALPLLLLLIMTPMVVVVVVMVMMMMMMVMMMK